MKKICLFLAAVMMLFCFAGCGREEDKTQQTQPSGASEETEATVPPTTEPSIPEVIGYDITVPEGFKASVAEDDRVVYVSPYAPSDPSAIVIEVQPRDAGVLEFSEEEFKSLHGVQDYKKVSLEVIDLEGIPTLFADYTVKEGTVFTHIYEYHVVASQNYMFQFADSTDNNDWLDLYAGSVNTIQMLLADQEIQLDYSDLEHYNLDCGISLYAQSGMEKQSAPGFSACIGNRSAIILVMQDEKQTHDLEGMSLEEYADLISKSNDLDAFTTDSYGNLSVSFYSTDSDGVEYYNSLMVKETSDSFWVFQMTCAAKQQASFDREFARWGTSIRENG